MNKTLHFDRVIPGQRLWMEETEDAVLFHSGNYVPASKKNDHLPLIARRLHALVNHKIDDASRSYLQEVNAAIQQHNSKLSRFKSKPLDPTYLDSLLKEVTHFIALTNDEKLKKELEWNSPHYYLDLLNLFKKKHLASSQYPILYDLAKEFLPD